MIKPEEHSVEVLYKTYQPKLELSNRFISRDTYYLSDANMCSHIWKIRAEVMGSYVGLRWDSHAREVSSYFTSIIQALYFWQPSLKPKHRIRIIRIG